MSIATTIAKTTNGHTGHHPTPPAATAEGCKRISRDGECEMVDEVKEACDQGVCEKDQAYANADPYGLGALARAVAEVLEWAGQIDKLIVPAPIPWPGVAVSLLTRFLDSEGHVVRNFCVSFPADIVSDVSPLWEYRMKALVAGAYDDEPYLPGYAREIAMHCANVADGYAPGTFYSHGLWIGMMPRLYDSYKNRNDQFARMIIACGVEADKVQAAKASTDPPEAESNGRPRTREEAHAYFGACPICRKPGLCRNVHKDHWMCCDKHKVKWWAGRNIMSGWQHETPEIWEEHKAILAGYRQVESASLFVSDDEYKTLPPDGLKTLCDLTGKQIDEIPFEVLSKLAHKFQSHEMEEYLKEQRAELPPAVDNPNETIPF